MSYISRLSFYATRLFVQYIYICKRYLSHAWRVKQLSCWHFSLLFFFFFILLRPELIFLSKLEDWANTEESRCGNQYLFSRHIYFLHKISTVNRLYIIKNISDLSFSLYISYDKRQAYETIFKCNDTKCNKYTWESNISLSLGS